MKLLAVELEAWWKQSSKAGTAPSVRLQMPRFRRHRPIRSMVGTEKGYCPYGLRENLQFDVYMELHLLELSNIAQLMYGCTDKHSQPQLVHQFSTRPGRSPSIAMAHHETSLSSLTNCDNWGRFIVHWYPSKSGCW